MTDSSQAEPLLDSPLSPSNQPDLLPMPTNAADTPTPRTAAEQAAEPQAAEPQAAEPQAAEPQTRWTFFPIQFASSFAFCFSMREGMLLLAGLQLLCASFWIYALSVFPGTTWPSLDPLRTTTIVLLITNAGLGAVAIRCSSERCGLLHIFSFAMLLLLLLAELMAAHPPGCSAAEVIDGSPFGERALRSANARLSLCPSPPSPRTVASSHHAPPTLLASWSQANS